MILFQVWARRVGLMQGLSTELGYFAAGQHSESILKGFMLVQRSGYPPPQMWELGKRVVVRKLVRKLVPQSGGLLFEGCSEGIVARGGEFVSRRKVFPEVGNLFPEGGNLFSSGGQKVACSSRREICRQTEILSMGPCDYRSMGP